MFDPSINVMIISPSLSDYMLSSCEDDTKSLFKLIRVSNMINTELDK